MTLTSLECVHLSGAVSDAERLRMTRAMIAAREEGAMIERLRWQNAFEGLGFVFVDKGGGR